MSKYILPTYTGKLFDLEDPKPEMICIEDIAHHLAYENRYNGSTRFPYPVAYHCLLGVQFAPEELKLEFLLHDRDEAYYKDWPSPTKRLINDIALCVDTNFDLSFYEDLIYQFNIISAEKFKLDTSKSAHKVIKAIDLNLASTEITQLLWNFPPEHWQHDFSTYAGFDMKIYEQCPSTVEQMFKDEFNKLKRN